MDLRKEEFPVALQAYEMQGDKENFLAEQVVNSQPEADNFISLYAGRIIKTRDLRPVETRKFEHRRSAGKYLSRRQPVISPWLILLLVVIVLVIIGFTTGWFQTIMGKPK